MARPREFEVEQALSDLTGVFWREGYEGASMQDIERATGLKKQSLYRAFGDKRAMYDAALRHYEKTEIEKGLAALSGSGTARDKIERLFDAAIAAVKSGDRRGCFLCNASTDQAQHNKDAQARIKRMIARMEAGVNAALAGDAPYASNLALRKSTALKILSVYMGLRLLARSGAEASKLGLIKRQVINEL